MKLHWTLCVILTVASVCNARPVPAWSYEKLLADADLVVIATPVETKDLKEPAVLPNVTRAGEDGKPAPVAAIGMDTKFEVQAVFKGQKKELKEFVLYHLREPDTQAPVVNGPMLVRFDPKEKRRYLLFLKREADGRYASVTGQTDAAIGVKELGSYP